MAEGKTDNIGGRPEEHIEECLFDEICYRISTGGDVRTVCGEVGVSVYLFYKEKTRRQGFSEFYECAQEGKAESLYKEAQEILSVDPPLTEGKYDSAYVQIMKARADAKMRLADRINPVRQKIDQKVSTPDGKNPFSIVVDVRR